MYSLITEAKEPIQFYDIRGTVGTESITKENIIADTLVVSNQCSDSSEFRLGGVYIGQMSCTFHNVDIARNEWVGKEIALEVLIGQTWIPTGVFVIDKASHSKGYVSITAYDKMTKLDRAIGIESGAYGFPYDFLVMISETCNITLGMTEEEVRALPNGMSPFQLAEMGDIETWRDLLFWLATSLCAFATFDRNGNLVLRTFHSEVDDELDHDIRYNVSTYGDEVITYTGINVYSVEDEAVEYYAAEVDDGYTLNVGNNPFFQISKAQRQIYVENMLDGIADIQYNTCKVEVPFAWHYDLGDVLSFPNGQGSDTDLFCVMAYSFKFNGHCVLTGIAGQKASMSKTDKNLQGMMSTVSRNEFTSYELRNTGRIVVEDGERERLIQARIASNTSTKAQIHVEINLESLSSQPIIEEIESFADIWQGITDSTTKGTISYLLNSEDVLYYPEETWVDGKHVLHLMYIMPLEANTINTFDIYLESNGGTITIERGGVWFYASGAGLVGDGKWDGTINIAEETTPFYLADYLAFSNISDSVSITYPTNHTPTASDVISAITFNDISIGSVRDDVLVTLHSDMFALTDETGENALAIEEDDETRLYTEGDEE